MTQTFLFSLAYPNLIIGKSSKRRKSIELKIANKS